MALLRSGLLVVIALATSHLRAEPICPDDLFNAYMKAVRGIGQGAKLEDVLPPLKSAVDSNPNSRFAPLAQRLARDVATSIDQATARTKAGRMLEDVPEEFLTESKMPLHLLAFPQNWEQGLPHYVEEFPRDPAVLLLGQDRRCIDRLIKQLSNHSPTREIYDGGYDDIPEVPRVSALALYLIERVSRCKFNVNSSAVTPIHELSENKQEMLSQHIAKWWEANRDKSVAEGIRAQLPHGDFYGQITMAENLIRAAGEGNAADREYGLEVLRRWSRNRDDNTAAHAARSLEKFGDLSPLELYSDRLRKSLSVRGRYYSQSLEALWYLADHGQRKEWELLRDIAVKDETENHADVLVSLLNSKQCAKVPYAIPLLGLGLGLTKQSGSRYINEKVGSQSFSTADKAVEYLQKLTEKDFGYRVEGTDQERAAAIERAQKWWTDEGQAKYTFDYIEQNVVKERADRKVVP